MKEIIPEVKQSESEVQFKIPAKSYSSKWRAAADKETQKVTLEKLRYKYYVRRGTLGFIMVGIRKKYEKLMKYLIFGD